MIKLAEFIHPEDEALLVNGELKVYVGSRYTLVNNLLEVLSLTL